MKKEITLEDVKKFADNLICNYNETAEEIIKQIGFLSGDDENTKMLKMRNLDCC